MEHVLKTVSVHGFFEMLPARASETQINVWVHQHTFSMKTLAGAIPTLQIEAPIKNTEMSCHMNEDHLYFFVLDHDHDSFPVPCVFECMLEKKELPIDRLSLYMDCKNPNRGLSRQQASLLENQRTQIHEELANFILSRLKDAGMNFRLEYRATHALHDLTALWFDLLDLRGKLDPRSAAQRAIAVRQHDPK